MSEILIPIAILAVICLIAFVGYRALAGSNRGASGDADSGDNVPKQPARDDRPLGDTPDAHDEISPHDLPLDNPGRHAAEHMAGHEDGTTRGMADGGGASDTERFSRNGEGSQEVSDAEAKRGADST